ncbi:hypothetical protein CLV51_108191 [Chitinophaga niastensis]|uniref:Uncharacterized protein n=1 Tax=Chitinophaga niastensis TaxID=536980 RepID=A0A2P8HB84_CHINA|nr:hypothetical protein CLV51_108191 [Chitinophaga niastensis]
MNKWLDKRREGEMKIDCQFVTKGEKSIKKVIHIVGGG